MNRNDVIDLLSAIAAADRRTVGKADVEVWQQVIGELPKGLAIQAMRDHWREEPGVWLEPGHIFQRVRAFMRDHLEREPDDYREARQAAIDAKAAPDTEDRGHWVGPLKHHRPQVNWLKLVCPHCGARAGARCVVPGTNRPPYGGTHPARLDAARQAADEPANSSAHRTAHPIERNFR
jgi:hypothetical protein